MVMCYGVVHNDLADFVGQIAGKEHLCIIVQRPDKCCGKNGMISAAAISHWLQAT